MHISLCNMFLHSFPSLPTHPLAHLYTHTHTHAHTQNTHVPGYIAKAEEFKGKGVDDIVVLSVNDCFAMQAWAKTFETDKVCVCVCVCV